MKVKSRACAFISLVALVAAMIWSDSALAQVWPTSGWPTATPAQMGMDEARLSEAANYALTGGGSGMISRGGYLVYSWGDQRVRYDIKSATKSLGGTALGLGLGDNFVTLAGFAQQSLPTLGIPPDGNAATGWLDDITILQLATHTSGFDKPGGYISLLYAPGTMWSYSDGGANWLADVLTQVYREDLNTLLFRRVFTRLGVTSADLVWRSNAYREDTLDGVKRREFGSGFRINVDAMGRIGYLYLRNGNWAGEQLLPASFVEAVRRPSSLVTGLPVADPVKHPNASQHYGMLWWTNADATLPGVPTDAYWAWGLGDSLVVVIPSLDIVAVRAGEGLGRTTWSADYTWIAPFIAPIVHSVTGVSVPQVVDLTRSEAESAITASGLTVGAVTLAVSATVPAGGVISQDPLAGTPVTAGSAVNLVVSSGAELVSVPAFLLLPSSLAFGGHALNVTSAGQSINLESTGTATLAIMSIGLTGANADQFAQTGTCGASVAPGSSCTITVTFRPTSSGTKTAALTVATEGEAGTKSVPLSGTGVKAIYGVSPTSISFGSVTRKTTSAPAEVTVSNTGTVALPITSISLRGSNPKQFAQTNTCGTEVSVGGSCIISVVFLPTSTGSKTASLTVTPGGGASKKSVALSGSGI